MLNRIILIGRLTRDPELKYTPSGLPVAHFGLAVDRPFKNAQGERDVDFFNIVAWRQRAEFVSQYASKGRLIAVEGRVEIRSFVGQDGVKRNATDIVAENVQLLDSARDSGAQQTTSSGETTGAPPMGDEDFADPFSES